VVRAHVEELDHLILEHYGAAKDVIDRIMNDAATHVPWTILDGQDEKAKAKWTKLAMDKFDRLIPDAGRRVPLSS